MDLLDPFVLPYFGSYVRNVEIWGELMAIFYYCFEMLFFMLESVPEHHFEICFASDSWFRNV